MFVDMTAECCEAAVEDVTVSAIERVECLSSFADIASRWLALESDGIATPYQTFDWARAWCETAGAASGVAPLLVAGMDRRGRTIAILPLGIRRKAGVTIASFLGGKHSNINLGLFDRAAMARLTGGDIERMLRDAAVARGVDVFQLMMQPPHYAGFDNPLGQLGWKPSSCSCWTTPLEADGEAMIRRLRSSESLRKLRAKARKLGEVGPLAYVQGGDIDSIGLFLDAFFRQKADQFRRMGVADPYANRAVRQFVERSVQGAENRAAPVSVWALKAGDRIAAVFAGAAHAGRLTGMFMSYDADPAIARHSPGELLLQHVIKASCERGLTDFDLGSGDGPYKQDYCPVEKPLFDSVLPTTWKGRAAALAITSSLAAKRAAKRHPLAMRVVDRALRMKAALRQA